jgi:hypothetical protein
MALFGGHAEIVSFLLDHGADPGQSIYTYDSWNKLLSGARLRGYELIESRLVRAMQKRFRYSADFDVLKQAIIARDDRRVGALLKRHPHLALGFVAKRGFIAVRPWPRRDRAP